MACTPRKVNVIKIVPEPELCVACSSNSKQRYYILKKNGERGPSFDIVSKFYGYNLNCTENWGSYLCKTCNRTQSRVIESRENADKLYNKLQETTQCLHERTYQKRVIVRTPDNRGKRPLVHVQDGSSNNLGM